MSSRGQSNTYAIDFDEPRDRVVALLWAVKPGPGMTPEEGAALMTLIERVVRSIPIEPERTPFPDPRVLG